MDSKPELVLKTNSHHFEKACMPRSDQNEVEKTAINEMVKYIKQQPPPHIKEKKKQKTEQERKTRINQQLNTKDFTNIMFLPLLAPQNENVWCCLYVVRHKVEHKVTLTLQYTEYQLAAASDCFTLNPVGFLLELQQIYLGIYSLNMNFTWIVVRCKLFPLSETYNYLLAGSCARIRDSHLTL